MNEFNPDLLMAMATCCACNEPLFYIPHDEGEPDFCPRCEARLFKVEPTSNAAVISEDQKHRLMLLMANQVGEAS